MKRFQRNHMPRVEWLDERVKVEMEKAKQQAMLACGGEMFLHIEFTAFEFPVIFNQAPVLPFVNATYGINDPLLVSDVHEEQNPVEMKYLKLAHRSSIYDKDMKPDQSERVKIYVSCMGSIYTTFFFTKILHRKLFRILHTRASLWKKKL